MVPQLMSHHSLGHRNINLWPEYPVFQLFLAQHSLSYPGQFVLYGMLERDKDLSGLDGFRKEYLATHLIHVYPINLEVQVVQCICGVAEEQLVLDTVLLRQLGHVYLQGFPDLGKFRNIT